MQGQRTLATARRTCIPQALTTGRDQVRMAGAAKRRSNGGFAGGPALAAVKAPVLTVSRRARGRRPHGRGRIDCGPQSAQTRFGASACAFSLAVEAHHASASVEAMATWPRRSCVPEVGSVTSPFPDGHGPCERSWRLMRATRVWISAALRSPQSLKHRVFASIRLRTWYPVHRLQIAVSWCRVVRWVSFRVMPPGSPLSTADRSCGSG
jgi:hypothetical protein